MYLDLGHERGKIKFTWKELVAIIGMVASLVTHYTMTEIRFSEMQVRTDNCEKRLKESEKHLEELERRFEIRSSIIPPLYNLLILTKYNDRQYLVQTDNGQAFNITMCHDTDFQKGQKFKVFAYEQLFGCKNIQGPNLGFIAYTDSRGNRIIFK